MKNSIGSKFRALSGKHKLLVGIGTTTFVLATVGGVAALWSATASGPSNTEALTAVDITVAGATATADLYPGFTLGDVYFTLTNTNPYPVTFSSMTAGAVVSGNPTACPASNVTVINKTGLALAVAANSTSATLSITDVVTMVSAAPTGCQGVTFTIPLTLTGTQT